MTDYDKNSSMMSEKPNVEETPVKTRERKTKTLFEKDRQAFFSDLLRFHENRGTPIARIPKIPGCKIDLHQLYQSIITRGGWLKVNSKNEWEEVLKEVGFPAKCVNSEIALKHIYIRYFDKYERYNFHGENEREKIDEDDDDNTSNRHKRWSAKSLHYVPQNYNYNHHNINESSRANLKLSTDLFYASEYDKLVMSLLSPLPNEQDFAINVCTLMSNECKQTLKINKCPRLIFALLAHAGIFDHYAVRDMFTEFYTKIRKHSQQQFWKDLLYEKPDVLELLYVDFYDNEEIYLNPKKCEEFFKKDKEQDGSEANDYYFLSLGRGLGTHDYIGSRILQIISILRNLSFNEENILVLARHRTLLRFLIMSANIRWSNVHHYSLDILGNIGNELDLKDPFADIITRQLFGTVCDGLESEDRGVIISCLEILSKISQKESNEEFLCKYLRKKTYQQIGLFLTIKDLMLIIYTLECIYALTSIGEKPCNSFVDIHGVLDSLVSLVTVEAHSFGPDACILMKVVETIPSGRNYQQIQNIRQNLNMSQQIQQPISQPVQQIHIPHIVEQPRTPPRFVVQSMESPVKIDPNNIAQKHNQQQILQENEQFALAWLRATFELSVNLLCRIEEQELYRMYIGASSKVGRKGVLSPQHFPRCVRSVFGGTIGPNPSKDDEKTFYYTGIKLRIHAAERTTTTNIVTSSDNQMKQEIVIVGPKNDEHQKTGESVQKHIVTSVSSSPLLQQVLSTNPADKNVTVSHMNQTIVSSSSHVVMPKGASQDTLCPVPGLTQAPTTTTASSLIKSLLANKVTSHETNTTASVNSCLVTSNASNMHQVAQRQQLQQQTKQKQMNEQIQQQQQQQQPVTTMIQTVNQIQQKPLMVTTNNQSMTNIKIGSSTISIKPGTLPNNTVITANPIPMEKHETIIKTTTVEPPPLAPLSIQPSKIEPNKMLVAASQKISANKMLVDLLDKKALEPPVFPSLEKTVTLKRKIDGSTEEIPAKKADTDNIVDANPNAKAADLYAKLAGSILEDEEMEEDDGGLKLIEKKVEASKPASQIINTTPVPVQRQIIMTPNNQMILSPGAGTPTATIKTDSGIQTVPILLQNNSLHMQQGIQGQFIQQVQPQSAPTQYILATNNQGQTYVVAQQQAPQTVLLAQTQQQQGTPTKTIIILQQQPQQQIGSNNSTTIQQIAGGLNVAPQSSQKIIMTPHGQQVIVTQMPRQFHSQQQQVIQGYQQTNVLPSNTSIIQGQSSGIGNRKIIITNTGNTMEVDATKPTENQQTQQIMKQFTTASGTKIIQTMQPQVYQQSVPTSQVSTVPTQIQTKIIQGTSQQAIQTIQQGQNIIMQKGQKFQIGNTQISQIIQQPQQTQIVQQQNPTTPQQQQQQQIIIQKTIKVDQLQQPVGQPQQQPQIIQNQPTQTQIVHVPHGNVTISESQVMLTETKTIQQSTMQQHPPQQQQPALIPTTIQHHNVTIPISQPQQQQQQSIVGEASGQSAQKNSEESHKKSEDPTDQSATSTSATTGQTAPVKTFSIQIPVPAGAQSGTPQHTVKVIPAMDPNKIVEEDVDPNWLYVCDWRGCPKKKFASANEVYLHACAVHCPPIDGNPDIYCQWGAGNSLCDNLPRKRFSLMTHIYDRHCTTETFKAAVQKRLSLLENPPTVKQPYPVTLVRMPAQSGATTTPESAINLQNGPTTIQNAGTAAMHAIKRHSSDYINSKELLDDPEGPVTKSIRLTASLILRNLVNYSHGAKRALKYHESHLASIALSNVESSRTIAQVLYEMNDAHPV